MVDFLVDQLPREVPFCGGFFYAACGVFVAVYFRYRGSRLRIES